MFVTGRQIRAARALLGWTRADLAEAAGLHPNSVAYWENTTEIPTRPSQEPHACRLIRKALRAVGLQIAKVAPIAATPCRKTNKDTSTHGRARARHGVLQITSQTDARAHMTLHQAIWASAECGARTRPGRPCARKALKNGRCRNHGGKSTGPKSEAGCDRISQAQMTRWRKWRSEREAG